MGGCADVWVVVVGKAGCIDHRFTAMRRCVGIDRWRILFRPRLKGFAVILGQFSIFMNVCDGF